MVYPKIGVLVLHYITTNETVEFLKSVREFYPDMQVLIVDNGSPEDDLQLKISEFSDMARCLRLPENLGFAKGLNAGISLLRREGCSVIFCSNNDILFLDSMVLDLLTKPLIQSGYPVSGPAIMTPKGRNQNPLLLKRPDQEEAKKMVKYYSLGRIWSRYLLNRFVLSPLKRRFRKHRQSSEVLCHWKQTETNEEVYALNGAFFALGPAFFALYEGLDPSTFLYGEELILAEMVHITGAKMLYVQDAKIFHKEDKTSNLVWGGEDRIQPALYSRESICYWYRHHFLKNEFRFKQGDVCESSSFFSDDRRE